MTRHTGRCLCGKVQYRLNEEPLTVYACHCTDCQKRTGSAFGLSLWMNRAAIEVLEGEPVLREPKGPDGKPRPMRECPECGTRLWSEPAQRPTLAIVRTGTLDDTSWVRPLAHIWTRSAQKWFAFPEGVPRYEQQPPSFADLLRKKSPS